MSLEKDIQAKIIAKMEAHGWYVVKLIQTNKNGIPDIPGKYHKPEGRIQAEPSMNPVKLIGGGNAITYGALFAGIILLCGFVFLVALIVRKIRSSFFR